MRWVGRFILTKTRPRRSNKRTLRCCRGYRLKEQAMLYNVREYHRPTDLAEALRLLRRTDIKTIALAGGVSVVGEGTSDIEAVVDLDGLNLDFVDITDESIRLGATVRLQTVVDQLTYVGSGVLAEDRKSTRLNSSHQLIS